MSTEAPLKILSLGAGIQSTVLALRGRELGIDACVFADTGEEPVAVYRHLEWLEGRLAEARIPLFKASAGRLGDDLIAGRNSTGQRFAPIPAFTRSDAGGEIGKVRRQCTKEYKTSVVERTIRREILGLKPRQRVPREILVIQVIGLSADEPARVIRVRQRFEEVAWARPWFPLFDAGESRADCVEWLRSRVPHVVPRSACTFCPFKSQAEWRALKESPEDWARACQIDDALRNGKAVTARNMTQKLYVHRSCVPLPEADLRDRDERIGQGLMNFGMAAECEGMCGL